MRLISFPLSCLLLLHAISTLSYAKEDAARGDEADLHMAQESNEAAGNVQGQSQGQPNPASYEGQNSQNPRGNPEEGHGTQGQQRLMQGQDQQPQDPQYQQRPGTQNQTQGQHNPGSNQGQQNPQHQEDPSNPTVPQPNPNIPQGQGTNPAPNTQGQRGQGAPIQQPGVGQPQDQLPPEPPQVKLPKKPRVFPSPTPTLTAAPAPTFIPAPPPEPTTRPLPSGPKTDAQRSYESAMQTRWKTAAEEIALLRSRGESLQGKKGKAFRESVRTASGNRSIARTKLNQLVRGSSADFDKLKTGVERAFADLDSSIARVRSYFDEPPPP